MKKKLLCKQKSIIYGLGDYLKDNEDLLPNNIEIIGYGYSDTNRATSNSGSLLNGKEIYTPDEIKEILQSETEVIVYICSGPRTSLDIFYLLMSKKINLKNIRFIDESRALGFSLKKVITDDNILSIKMDNKEVIKIHFYEETPLVEILGPSLSIIADVKKLTFLYQTYITLIKKYFFKPNVIQWLNGAFPQSLLNKDDIANDIIQILPKYIGEVTLNNISDMHRLYSMVLNIKHIMEKGVSGDFAELGVYKGCTAAILKYYAQQFQKRLYLYDTFEGFPEEDLVNYDEGQKRFFSDTSDIFVKKYIDANEDVILIKGYFPKSIPWEQRNLKFSFVNIDCDLYKPMLAGLEFFYPRLSEGGMIFLHDYSSGYWNGCKQAIDEYCEKNGIQFVLLPDLSGTAVITKNYGKTN
jgi:hypothetical protein